MNANVFLSGVRTTGARWTSLRAGPLTLEFDPGTVALRYIRWGDREILRCIYAAVRDRHWGTVRPMVSDLVVEERAESFEINFRAHCQQQDIDFTWTGRLTGNTDGSLSFAFDGQALSSFLRNRIGLCVLHPLTGCTGQPCTVEHSNGDIDRTEFPRLVSPWQPFRDVRALTHDVLPGLAAELRLRGDIFETEDHRNWTDASFKTYSTPLALPFPVRVEAGAQIQQEVKLTLQRRAATEISVGETRARPTLVVARAAIYGKPRLGLGVASHEQPLSPRQAERLRTLKLSHLRVDLHWNDAQRTDRFRRASCEARELGVDLYVALHWTEAASEALDEILALVRESQSRIGMWLVLSSGAPATSIALLETVRTRLERFDPKIPVAAGTDANFAELNRNRLPAGAALPCYSVNPQVHASDDASVMENLGGLAGTVATAREFSGEAPVISPITLRPRFNPNATSSAVDLAAGRLPASVDPRQMSLFGAAWTVGSLAALAVPGPVHSLTYFETTGWRGVMETETGSPLPEQFLSRAGEVFPLFHVFASLAGFTHVVPVECDQPLRAVGLGLLDGGGRLRLLLANLGNVSLSVCLRVPGSKAAVNVLDLETVERAGREPEPFAAEVHREVAIRDGAVDLSLGAYAVGRVDVA